MHRVIFMQIYIFSYSFVYLPNISNMTCIASQPITNGSDIIHYVFNNFVHICLEQRTV